MKHGNNKPMLAVDCSTTTASIALAASGGIHTREIDHGRQAAELVPAIDALLKEHGVKYSELACLLTTLGPGSFTGLRVALATVHALSLAHAIPTRAVTSLQSVAYEVKEKHFRVALNAGKGEVFVQEFNGTEPYGAIELMKPDQLPAGTITDYTPHAATLCRVAEQLPLVPLAELLPLYIRPPDAKPATLPPWLQTT